MADKEAPIGGILDELKDAGDADTISMGEILDAFQHRSLGVLLVVFSLIAALPVIGAIPGMSILTGALILVAIGESLIGRGSLWLPQFLRKREVGREKFSKVIDKSRPWLAWIDGLVKPRLTFISAGKRNRWIVSFAAALLALGFFPMAFVPYGVMAPALAVTALGLGLMASDGVFILIGYALAALTGYLIFIGL